MHLFFNCFAGKKAINIKKLLLLVFAGMIIGCQTPQQPNILFIAVDDLRPELGCYGSNLIQSPALDKLASEGRVFFNHFVQVPTCGASRACLLTGRYPTKKTDLSNQAIVHKLSGAKETEVPETFIHHFRRNGYYTVGIGKISHYADGLVYGYTEQPTKKRELPYSWDELIFDPGKWETGWNAFFGYADGENRQSMQRQVKPYEQGAVDDEGYVDGLTANLAVSTLEKLKDKEQPFFLGVGFFKPHLPFNAPKKYWDMYDEKDIPLSPNQFIPENVHKSSLHESGEFNGYHLTDEKAGLHGPLTEDYQKLLQKAYFSCISYTDAQIGKILSELERLGLSDNTIVMVWGDHGWHLGQDLVWGKQTLFDYALRSTLIVKTPGMAQRGKPTNALIGSVDIYPTLLELTGLEAPAKLDGRSFAKVLMEPSAKGKEAVCSYYNQGISIRTPRYRLTRYFREEKPDMELFDYENDPLETKNVAHSNPEIIQQLMPLWEKADTGIHK